MKIGRVGEKSHGYQKEAAMLLTDPSRNPFRIYLKIVLGLSLLLAEFIFESPPSFRKVNADAVQAWF